MSYYKTKNTNDSLNAAKSAQRDEFYTPYAFIKEQLAPYVARGDFKGATIYCPCDNPWTSNFVQYFIDVFNVAGLKKLIATCTAPEPATPGVNVDAQGHACTPWIAEITKVDDEDNGLAQTFSLPGNSCKPLAGDGDFASKDLAPYFEECDFVVTNPPFSKFALFVKVVSDYKRDFMLVGNINACTYQSIWPRLKEGSIRICTDVKPATVNFAVPDSYELNPASGDFQDMRTGVKYASLRNVRWYTTLDPMNIPAYVFTKTYTPAEYPRYDNVDAIEVNRVANIPWGYAGVMGLPVTFFDSYDTSLFELVGDIQDLTINGQKVYKRVFVKIREEALK